MSTSAARKVRGGAHGILLVAIAVFFASLIFHRMISSEKGAPEASGPGESSASQVEVGQSSLKMLDRAYRGLTIDQMLDRALSLPGARGDVRGVVTGGPVARNLPDLSFPRGKVVSNFPFVVTSFVGTSPSPYLIGATISLRIPGGTAGGVTMSVEDPVPQVAAGQELYVFVRGQADIDGGPNTTTVLVASDPTDVFEVKGATVYGSGEFSGFSEPVATFERHNKR